MISRRTLVIFVAAAVGVASLTLMSCSSIGYYSQAASGHLKLMNAREPIDELLETDSTDPELRKKLQTLVDARVFAIEILRLPANDSYTTYAATGRDYVTWNVVAAEEFSLQPKTWCFPVAGCVSYKGYFKEQAAKDYAAVLAAEQYDVTVGGASAYSTLGWFDDPVLDTMLRGGDIRYVGTLFHEMAHQVLYVKDDSNFNEAFASFVEQQGMRIWLQLRDENERISKYEAFLKRSDEFNKLLQVTQTELRALYSQELEAGQKREQKKAVFDDMQEGYVNLKESWGGYSGYDRWFSREINNARLLSVATYRKWVPAFEAIYNEKGRSMEDFYTAATKISELPKEERQVALSAYLPAGGS
ncbi:MAG: aminopeptidase [Granulosicoccaceae bacterium]